MDTTEDSELSAAVMEGRGEVEKRTVKGRLSFCVMESALVAEAERSVFMGTDLSAYGYVRW